MVSYLPIEPRVQVSFTCSFVYKLAVHVAVGTDQLLADRSALNVLGAVQQVSCPRAHVYSLSRQEAECTFEPCKS